MGMRRDHMQKQQFGRSGHGDPAHGKTLPRVRSAATYALPGAALLLALSVVGLPVNGALGGSAAVVALLIVLAILALVCLLVAASIARDAKRAIPRILTDTQTIHWTCTPEEWQRFGAREWRRSIRRTLKLTGMVWGFLLVVAVLGFLQPNGSLNVALPLALSAGLAGIFGLLLFAWAATRLQLRRHATTTDAYISGDGLIVGGWYAPLYWAVGGRKQVTYIAGDPGILSIEVGTGRGAQAREAPVPQGHEAEAEKLAANRAWLIRTPRNQWTR
jgi:hypothetical protein